LAQANAESVTTMAVNGYGIDLRQLLLQIAFDGI
jgi:hypothetical protein